MRFPIRIPKRLETVLILSTCLLTSIPGISTAVEFANGTRAFNHPPRLEKAVTTHSSTYSSYATYYFTIVIPENAGEPLSQLTIALEKGADYDLAFDLRQSSAIEGADFRKRKLTAVAIATTTYDRPNRQITLGFNPPIPAGKTVTVGLKPYSNPSSGGVYLFEVTAYPPGKTPKGQFLGYGRLAFYGGGSN